MSTIIYDFSSGVVGQRTTPFWFPPLTLLAWINPCRVQTLRLPGSCRNVLGRVRSYHTPLTTFQDSGLPKLPSPFYGSTGTLLLSTAHTWNPDLRYRPWYLWSLLTVYGEHYLTWSRLRAYTGSFPVHLLVWYLRGTRDCDLLSIPKDLL